MNLYMSARIKVHEKGHKPGEMGFGLFRYDAESRTWTALGGLAPSVPPATHNSILWEDNGHGLGPDAWY